MPNKSYGKTLQILLTEELPSSERQIMWKATKGVHYMTAEPTIVLNYSMT